MPRALRKHLSSLFISQSDSFDHGIGISSPIQNFTPQIWRLLDPKRDVLRIDLLWPQNINRQFERHTYEDENGDDNGDYHEPNIFPYDGLRTLLMFRNLHTLQLTGMLRSYQPLIWATCWLNPNLTTLHLEMVLEPLINVSSDLPYREIDSNWSLRSNFLDDDDDEREYLGHHGTGILHEEFGDGEYLDTQAIKLSALDVAEQISDLSVQYLPIKKLKLMNIVIDRWPIMRWFDPTQLEEIVFRSGCIDAGFYLPYHMMHVKVQVEEPPSSIARAIKRRELKVLELNKGQVISSQYAAMADVTSVPVLRAASPTRENTLRHKISQLIPRMAGRKGSLKRNNKENAIVAMEVNNADRQALFSEDEIRAAKDGKKPIR
jgi:hypothetical protein